MGQFIKTLVPEDLDRAMYLSVTDYDKKAWVGVVVEDAIKLAHVVFDSPLHDSS